MNVIKMPISQSQWESLSPGDGLEDKYGRAWGVVTRDQFDRMKLKARCPGFVPMILVWKKGKIHEEIDGGNYLLREFDLESITA